MDTPRREMMDEYEVKARCIDFLLSKHGDNLDDYVIANELKFAAGSRRADIVELNGSIHAYEVKSDIDTLDRLLMQVTDYLSTFDTLTIVTTAKHVDKVMEMIPAGVGIMLVNSQGAEIIRRAAKYKKFSKYNLAAMLSIPDLETVLRDSKVAGRSKFHAFEKRDAVSKLLDSDELRRRAIETAKLMHRPAFASFMKYRGQHTLPDDIKLFWQGVISIY